MPVARMALAESKRASAFEEPVEQAPRPLLTTVAPLDLLALLCSICGVTVLSPRKAVRPGRSRQVLLEMAAAVRAHIPVGRIRGHDVRLPVLIGPEVHAGAQWLWTNSTRAHRGWARGRRQPPGSAPGQPSSPCLARCRCRRSCDASCVYSRLAHVASPNWRRSAALRNSTGIITLSIGAGFPTGHSAKCTQPSLPATP